MNNKIFSSVFLAPIFNKQIYFLQVNLLPNRERSICCRSLCKEYSREIEVNTISTVFGRRNSANLPKNEEVIYRSKKITPEQSSLLERPNFAQYPTEQELSVDKGTTNNETEKEVENDIRGIFPKDNAEWLNWINQNKLLYVDKEKIQTLINQQRINLAEVEYLDLDSVAKVVKDFENPSIEEKKWAKGTHSFFVSSIEVYEKSYRKSNHFDYITGDCRLR